MKYNTPYPHIMEALERTRDVYSDNAPVCPNEVIDYIEAELQSIREERIATISTPNNTSQQYTHNEQYKAPHNVSTITLTTPSNTLIEIKGI